MSLFAASQAANDGVFVRFRLNEPAGAKYYVKLGGYIHQPNWYLPEANVPADAEKARSARVAVGQFTEWFDLAAYGGKNLHGRLNLAGGIAEFPNINVRVVSELALQRCDLEIELATAARKESVV